MTTTPRVLIATPTYGGHDNAGSLSIGYVKALHQCLGPNVHMLASHVLTGTDLVRARSRAVRLALDGCYTHLLFWDADVFGDCAQCLVDMVAADKDVISALYPRKQIPTKTNREGAYVPMGFTLIKHGALERMWDAYYDHLHFDDIQGGRPVRTVALFQLLFEGRTVPHVHRALLSEDYSFCARWILLGGEIHVYDGPGAPLKHAGGHVYEATREELLPPEMPQ